jgi:hypothetical protein
MAFRLVISDTITVPVAGRLPDANGRGGQPFSFTLVCKRLPADELKAELESEERTVPEFLTRVVRDWYTVQDDAGNDLPFTPTALASLLNIVGMSGLIFRAYIEACGVKGKEKN